ncbi:MAG: YwaF family protein [Clostridia bacterium]|nr:YwaF family protein [Clostridia bacterium]
MKNFFEMTAITMQTPKSYGPFHLIFVFVGIALCILFAYLLRNTNEKQNKLVLGSVGGFLVLTEIYKQLFYYYVIGNGSYQWWIFPFQLCSVPMYLCIIILFIKNEKLVNILYDFMFTINMSGGLISFSEPSGLNHPYLTLTLHAYIWHLLLIFLGLYLYFSNRACNTTKGYVNSIITLGVFCVIAQFINIVLRKPGLNLFYISPFVQSPIFIFETIYAKFGWLVNMIVYLFAICLGSAIIYALFYKARKIKKKSEVCS